MTPEHLWSDWMSPHLPGGVGESYFEFMHNFRNKNVPTDRMAERTRQGGVKTKRIKAVCRECNNGWMSGMETAVKPILIPLLLGRPTLLNLEARKILTEWIVLKVLVSEHNGIEQLPTDPIFDQEARNRFKATREIPARFRIWIGMHNGTKWKSAFYRHSTGLLPIAVPLPVDTTRKNTQSVTFGLGSLLIYVFATTSLEFYSRIELREISPPLLALWPLSDSDIRWRPFYVVGDADADRLTTALQNLVESPATLWQDE